MDDLTVTAIRVDPLRAGNRHPVSLNAIQVVQVPFASDEKGKITARFHFNIEGTRRAALSEQPVKSLGKVFDSSLKVNLPRSEKLVESNRPFWLPWQV